MFSDDEDTAEMEQQAALMRRQLPCMQASDETNESDRSLRVDCFVGRRLNKYTGDVDFRAKFTDRSHSHLAWLNFEQMQQLVGTGSRDRMRIQTYERKLKREGYGGVL